MLNDAAQSVGRGKADAAPAAPGRPTAVGSIGVAPILADYSPEAPGLVPRSDAAGARPDQPGSTGTQLEDDTAEERPTGAGAVLTPPMPPTEPAPPAEPPGFLARVGNFLADIATPERHVTAEGRAVIESSELLRWTVPGQAAWDEARSAYANDGLVEAGLHTTVMLGEIGLTVATAGLGGQAVQGAQIGVGLVDDAARSAPTVAAAPEARSLCAAINLTIEVTARQLQSKFKHADDFGMPGNYNAENGALFGQAIERHVASDATRVIPGTYRGQPVTHFVDPNTGLNVIRNAKGRFVSGWRLGAEQLKNVLRHGSLGGG